LFQRIIDVIEIDCLFVFRPIQWVDVIEIVAARRTPQKKGRQFDRFVGLSALHF